MSHERLTVLGFLATDLPFQKTLKLQCLFAVDLLKSVGELNVFESKACAL